ncbi:hypothetical protein BpHYR1_027035, partial [Brachionus plicatilis]
NIFSIFSSRLALKSEKKEDHELILRKSIHHIKSSSSKLRRLILANQILVSQNLHYWLTMQSITRGTSKPLRAL